MKKIILFFIVLIFSLNVFSQDPAIQWQNTIGGSDQDYFISVKQTVDGGYIFGGWSLSGISGDKTESCIGSQDYWIVKTDALGNIQWQNTIGGNSGDYFSCIQQTVDGGYILAGYSISNISGDKTENSWSNSLDYWIVKTDVLGNIQWQNTIGGSSMDYPMSIQQTADSGYIVGGYSDSNISGDKTENSKGGDDYWIVKIDVTGNMQWQKTIGGNEDDRLISVQQTADGGYILGGHSFSDISGDKTENNNGYWDYWIVKTDALGNVLWQNTIGGSHTDQLISIQQTTDNGYILGGWSWSNISGDKTENNWDTTQSDPDYWIVKSDTSGNILWDNTIGGIGYDAFYCIQQTSDGGYILGGYSNSNISGDKTENNIDITSPFSDDYWIVKTDASGNVQWDNTIGGSYFDNFRYVQQTSDGGYIVGGLSSSSISGDKMENCMGSDDYWIVKISPNVGLEEFFLGKAFNLYPNPATSELKIENGELKIKEIEIYSSIGENVFSQLQTSNLKLQTVDVSHLPPGIYFITVTDQAGNKVTKKVVKM